MTFRAADNAIRDAGAVAIAEALKVNKSVTYINLGSAWSARLARAHVLSMRVRRRRADCRIGDAGAAALGYALNVNGAILTLDVSCELSVALLVLSLV